VIEKDSENQKSTGNIRNAELDMIDVAVTCHIIFSPYISGNSMSLSAHIITYNNMMCIVMHNSHQILLKEHASLESLLTHVSFTLTRDSMIVCVRETFPLMASAPSHSGSIPQLSNVSLGILPCRLQLAWCGAEERQTNPESVKGPTGNL
jgi:hypothetical protein